MHPVATLYLRVSFFSLFVNFLAKVSAIESLS